MSDDHLASLKTSLKIKLPRNKFLDIGANKNVLEALTAPSPESQELKDASGDESAHAESLSETLPSLVKDDLSENKQEPPAAAAALEKQKAGSRGHPRQQQCLDDKAMADRKVKKARTPALPCLSPSAAMSADEAASASDLAPACLGRGALQPTFALFLGSHDYSPDSMLPDHRHSVGGFLDVYISHVHLSLANHKVAYLYLWGGNGSPPSYTDDSDLVAVLLHLGLVALTEQPAAHDLCARICIGPRLIGHVLACQGASGSFSRSWPCDHDGASFSVVKVSTLALGMAGSHSRRQSKKRCLAAFSRGKQSLSARARLYCACLELEKPSELPTDLTLFSNSRGEPCKKYSLYSFWLSLQRCATKEKSTALSLVDDLSLLERKLGQDDLILESWAGLVFKLAKDSTCSQQATYTIKCMSPQKTLLWSDITMHDIKWSNQTLKVKNDSLGLIKLYYWRAKELF